MTQLGEVARSVAFDKVRYARRVYVFAQFSERQYRTQSRTSQTGPMCSVPRRSTFGDTVMYSGRAPHS